ncbi:ankyrin [Saccharata proteae CBS 121410]|uniref:Ankyrin n=1 Tax=Saccharata proteae CBS 121410 TaxID=1314787 RepID=A0A9P4LY41_9PEZI|nr:ankyrin [Saccharata proteae CBS 121410]
MIDVAVRLRRAILLDDLFLVKRIIRANPSALRNPDFEDKSNTSLHLASKVGSVQIVAYLLDAGHEDDGISKNTDWDTPLMMAATSNQVDVGKLLATRFPRCVPYSNRHGLDALMLASKHGAVNLLIPLLTSRPPCLTTSHDNDGNTALHHASAAGELKCLRTLLQHGANPCAQNAYSWTPLAYSQTVAAKLYFEELVTEIERRRAEGKRDERERALRSKGVGGVRIVTNDENGSGRDDEAGLEYPPSIDFSPVSERKRALTPTNGRFEWPVNASVARTRASSGE